MGFFRKKKKKSSRAKGKARSLESGVTRAPAPPERPVVTIGEEVVGDDAGVVADGYLAGEQRHVAAQGSSDSQSSPLDPPTRLPHT